MGIYKRGNVYWVDYYDPNRKRIQESSQSSNRRDAENLLALRKSDILRGIYKQAVKITFGEFGKRAAVEKLHGFGDNLVTVSSATHQTRAVLSLNRSASYNISRA